MNDYKNNINEHQSAEKFTDSINFWGRSLSIVSLLAMFSVPFFVTKHFGISVSISEAIEASVDLIYLFLPMAVVENISYYPILGAGAIYLCSITGNVTNLKLPAAITGMKIASVKQGTPEGDVISIVAVAVSSVVTIIILVLGLFIGTYLRQYLESPTLKPGFDHIIPSLFGAVTIPIVARSGKLAIVPVVLAGGIYLLAGPRFYIGKQSYILLLVMICSMIGAYYLKIKKSEK